MLVSFLAFRWYTYGTPVEDVNYVVIFLDVFLAHNGASVEHINYVGIFLDNPLVTAMEYLWSISIM